MGNQPSVKMYFQPHGFVTVESRLELPEGMDTQNLSCAVSHPSWDEKKVLEPKPEKGQASAGWIASFYVFSVFGVLFYCCNSYFVSRCIDVQHFTNKPSILSLSLQVFFCGCTSLLSW